MLVNGGHVPDLEGLRSHHPEAVAEIETLAEVFRLDQEADRIARLRELSSKTPFAAVQLAEIYHSQGDHRAAGQCLADAADRSTIRTCAYWAHEA